MKIWTAKNYNFHITDPFSLNIYIASLFLLMVAFAIFGAEQFGNRLELCLVHATCSEIIFQHDHFRLYTFIAWFDENFFWKNDSRLLRKASPYTAILCRFNVWFDENFFWKNTLRLLRKGSPYTVIGRAFIYSWAG